MVLIWDRESDGGDCSDDSERVRGRYMVKERRGRKEKAVVSNAVTIIIIIIMIIITRP